MSYAYRTQPMHTFPWLEIQSGGYDALAGELCSRWATDGDASLVVIDGFVGVQWESFRRDLHAALGRKSIEATWVSTSACFLPSDHIDALLAPVLTSDPYFGRLHRGHLDELWDEGQVAAIRATVAARTGPTILYGFGASLLARDGLCVYVDVPKDRGQELAAAGTIGNIGTMTTTEFGETYKRFYFVDWPMLNRVKNALLPHLDLYVDATRETDPTFLRGDVFRRALDELARQPFRLKPWFTPGPWGGQWMKEKFGLPPEAPNYAWSFEMIAPENGILLGDGARTLEFSFDYLLWRQTEAVMGPTVAALFGSYFPLRFNYLDTMGGGNLSIQVHATADYMRDEFGEPIAEDETYYILANKPGAKIILGLRDDIDLARFKDDVAAARDQGIPFTYEDHLNVMPTKPHDLFLIPHGTVHSSAVDNVVLEISATPYIYTFKIYDYLRKDLRGQLRHIHLERAFDSIDATMTATRVREELCPRPHLLREGPGWAEYCIGNSARLFFAIHRLEFTGSIDDHTDNRVLALNMVEGQRCEILTENAPPVELRYAESIVIPATIGAYTLRNSGDEPCKVVKFFVRV